MEMSFGMQRAALLAALLMSGACGTGAQPGPEGAEVWEVDVAQGRPLHREILGQTWPFYQKAPAPGSAVSMRGVAGGLGADTYDWRTAIGGGDSPAEGTTLDYLRACRDHNWVPLITANLRGIPKAGSPNYASMDARELAVLAADWVVYCNVILPKYREGDTVTDPEAQRILKSITWSPKLLSRSEAPVPKVAYWELGNEPAVGAGRTPEGAHFSFQDHPEQFAGNYAVLAEAMLKADPSIKLGPCFAGGEMLESLAVRPHVKALFSSKAPMHFVSYHGYSYIHQLWPDGAKMSGVLRGDAWKTFAETKHRRVLDKLRECGRDVSEIEFMVSEYNPASWGDNNAQASMGRALGTAANLMAFMEHSYVMAHTWDVVTYTGVKWPVLLVFEKFFEELGDVFLGSYVRDGVVACATRSKDKPGLMVWGLNFDDNTPRKLEVRFPNAAGLASARITRLHNTQAATSVLDRNTAVQPQLIQWSEPAPLALENGRAVIPLQPLEMVAVKFEGALPEVRVERLPVAAPEASSAAAAPEPAPAAGQKRPARPEKPSGSLEGGAVRLAWTFSGEGVDGFVIQRSIDALEYPTLAEVPADAREYLDKAVTPGATLKYRIFAKAGGAISRYSDEVVVVIPGAGPGGQPVSVPRRHPVVKEPLLHLPLTSEKGIKLVGKNASASAANGLRLSDGSYAVVDPAPFVLVGPGCEATFSIWFKSDKPATLFSKSETHASPASHEYALILEKWGLRWMSAVNIRNYKALIGSVGGNYLDNKWHHVAVVCRDHRAEFHVNGQKKGGFDSLEWNITVKQPLILGGKFTSKPGAVYAHFDGNLRDLTIYQRALDDKEIAELASGKGSPP